MTKLNREVFFAYVRKSPFGNRLTPDQVKGMNLILDFWEDHYSDGDLRKLAYILATAFHETGGLMCPVREGFAKSDAQARKILANRKYAKPIDGVAYYGRGLVQLTWIENYARMGDILGIPLEDKPDLALDPEISVHILFEGMYRGTSNKGDFTGKSLEMYFNAGTDDPEGARAIINGKDKAALIAGYHYAFLDSLEAALKEEKKAEVKPEDAKPDSPGLLTDKTFIGAITTAGGGASAALIAAVQNPYALAAFAIIAIGLFLVLTGRIEIKNKAGA